MACLTRSAAVFRQSTRKASSRAISISKLPRRRVCTWAAASRYLAKLRASEVINFTVSTSGLAAISWRRVSIWVSGNFSNSFTKGARWRAGKLPSLAFSFTSSGSKSELIAVHSSANCFTSRRVILSPCRAASLTNFWISGADLAVSTKARLLKLLILSGSSCPSARRVSALLANWIRA